MALSPTSSHGGGFAPANWALVAFSTPAPLVPSPGSAHQFTAAEMTITAQSGDDFSVQTVSGHGAIVSAGGGMFQAAALIGCPAGATLDGSSTALRWLWFSLTVGSGPLRNLGYDSLVPIYPPGTDNGDGAAASSIAGLPGVVAPGGPAVEAPTIELIGGVGTDSIPLGGVFLPEFANLTIWQIAA